jgi:hypothetical protein
VKKPVLNGMIGALGAVHKDLFSFAKKAYINKTL